MGREGWTAVVALVVTAGLGLLAAACGESPTGPVEELPEVSQNPIKVPGIEVTVEEDDPWSCEESPACMSLLDEGAVGAGRIAAVRDSLIDNLPSLPLRR